VSQDPRRRLRDLDAELVPRLAAALRSLLDGVRRRVDVGRAVAAPSGGRALRRLDDRYASTGPLALLRDVPQLGLLLVAAVFLAGAGVALARSSPDRATDRQQAAGEQALPPELGPPVGADVDDHFETARARVLALVVAGTARQLAELTARPSVRGLEVARRGAELTALRVDALPPEVTGVRLAPVTAVPGGG